MGADIDAVVVGSGPNGLAAAVVLSSAGLSVRVLEAAESVGGGCRTDELTLPGLKHDVCSAVHPLAVASPFFKRFGLETRGVRLLQPEVQLAHPLDNGRAGVVLRSVEDTASQLGGDATAYRRLFGRLVADTDAITATVLSSMRTWPQDLPAAVRFARVAARSALSCRARFESAEAGGLIAGLAAHSMRSLDRMGTSGVALFLGLLAHAVGWPVVESGSQQITDAMVVAIRARGGEVVTGCPVRRLGELPSARIVLLDVTPRALVAMAGAELPAGYRRQLGWFRFGPGVCKVDWALSAPVPWSAEACRRSATVHVGGTFSEIARSEEDVAHGRHPERPFVLCAQPGVADPSRSPTGQHTLWTYCHVPAGSDRDMSSAMAAQLERFAPGFSDLVIAKAVRTATEVEAHDANYVGGDIASGRQDLWQSVARPVARWDPYRTPIPGVYLCSSSTPPGPGVHGRCGELAALSALRHELGMREPPDLGPDAG